MWGPIGRLPRLLGEHRPSRSTPPVRVEATQLFFSPKPLSFAMRKEARSLLYLAVLVALFLAQPVPASGQTPQSTILASMDHPSSLNLSEGSPQVV